MSVREPKTLSILYLRCGQLLVYRDLEELRRIYLSILYLRCAPLSLALLLRPKLLYFQFSI